MYRMMLSMALDAIQNKMEQLTNRIVVKLTKLVLINV